ncbi:MULTISPECIES: carbohydrate porin [Burkholderia cepacia complex]|uniref:carbohydrate porin n=1 Tax=Burkholderia cepacia complex TaxID=87882 RepID=UPI000B2553A3|nr:MULTISPECIES: carbohydrate porin [Burkholderia cepacia complex]MDN7681575.1 carbohydrate porin [Burkholderia cenocepacia]
MKSIGPAPTLNCGNYKGGDMKISIKPTGAIVIVAVTLWFTSFAASASSADQQVAGTANVPGSVASASPTGASPDVSLTQAESAQTVPPGVISALTGGAGGPPGAQNGPLSGIGDSLAALGISPRLLLTNLYVTNPSTGVATGKSANFFTVIFGADVDLSKLVGIPNTKFHFTEAWEPPSHNTKDFTTQAGSAFTPLVPLTVTNDLIKFTLSHEFFDKRLTLEYGRMNLTDDFFVATMCAGCVASTPAITELNVPGVTKSVWGARLAYALSRHSRLGLGVVEDNTALFRSSNGWTWNTKTRTGYAGVANYLYTSDFSDERYPFKAEAGVYHSTTPYSDALYSQDGTRQSLNPMGTPLKHSGTWGFYGQGRKVVWTRQGPGGPVPENVALYGGAFVTPGVGQSYPLEAYGGVEYGGFVKNNPVALIGATVRYIQLSSRRAQFEQELSTVTGNGSDPVHRNTFAFDVHGQYGLARGVLLNGFAQYLLHPNRVHGAASEGPTKSGWMFGVALLIDLGRLTGLTRDGSP